MGTEQVVESPSGTRHTVEPLGAAWWTRCGIRVPRARGWFGPVTKGVTCIRCRRATA